ncbi:MAG: DEAD/DEAH box helicase family protein [Bacteroidales bacterium]|nr:DEAD/DEAH box helicase family protein [Bacteroidales bacterium]
MKNYKDLLKFDLKREHENNFGKVLEKQPREHQTVAHAKMTEFYSEQGKRGILVLPTGAGKTYTAVYWLLKNILPKKKKVLWLADQGFLLEQARDEFKENILLLSPTLRKEINILTVAGKSKYSDTNKINNAIDILLITSQTAINSWNAKEQDDNGKIITSKFKEFVENSASNDDLFIVYDEAHHTPAFERRNLLIGGSEGKTGICQIYPNTQLLGLTATPSYTDKNKKGWLWEIFKDNIIFEVRKKELEDKKILAIPNYISEKTNFNSLILSEKEIENIVNKHQEIPYKIIEEISKNEDRNRYLAQYYWDNRERFEKTIIFVDRWYQCKTIEKYLNEKANKEIAASVFSYVDMNKNIDYINNRIKDQNDINLEKFKNGEIQVLLNVRMLTEGVDVPDVKTVFITRETNSTILFTQMVGRALRGEKAGGKKDVANIVFFIDNWNRHIQFASSKVIGGLEDEVKERGYRPLELINIDLIENLELEYEKQEYEISFIDMLPIGWYVVSYSDTLVEEIEDGSFEKSTENFTENVLIYKSEIDSLEKFINNYEEKHKSNDWEKEELPNSTEKILENWVTEYFPNLNKINLTATKGKFRQIARHLGQNKGQNPEFFTFEQRDELDLMKYVIEIREKDYGRNKTEEYLESVFYNNSNPFFKVLFDNFDAFYRAYNMEDEVYRKSKRKKATITGDYQTSKVYRLPSEKISKIVFARDENMCLCCGKTSHLQRDHILAFKNNEPTDDNPELYQTLCSTCNKEKGANEFNFRITNYKEEKIQVRDVKLASKNEQIELYLNRLINCYFATNAVQKSLTKASNNGNAIWRVYLKPCEIDLNYYIQKDKNKLIEIIKHNGFNLKDLELIIE